MLTDWAIRTRTDKVLEPSFGRCGFLAAARRRLSNLGCSIPAQQIFGCDVDEGAFEFLVEALRSPVDKGKFLQHDFLDLRAEEQWPHLFEAVIGNPPYIPFQAIPENQRHELSMRSIEKGIPIGGRASLWAHFLMHAVSFVAPGGRMAWVLPGAFLQADYASAIRHYLRSTFGEVLCVLMHQRFFKGEGTEEETVILLTKDRRDIEAPCEMAFDSATTIDELSTVIERWEVQLWAGRVLTARPAYLAVEESAIRQFEAVQTWGCCHAIGDFLRTTIGLVTGANSFFVISDGERKRLSLNDQDTLPVLGKFKATRGLSFTSEDHSAYLAEGGRGHLIHSRTLPPEGSALRLYLDSFTEEERSKIRTFRKRSIWHAPSDDKTPDAFLPVMHHSGPRLVLNDAMINCTNTIHRVYFTKKLPLKTKKLLTISLLTSFSQLSAEFVGRRYGSGVLKHEPREAEKISVLLPNGIAKKDVDIAFIEIDGLLRAGRAIEAQEQADKLVFHSFERGIEISRIFFSALSVARELRRSTRYIVCD